MSESEEEEDDTLYLETYGYPSVDILKDNVRICLGWFMPDLDPDEPAYYLDVHVDKKGKGTTFINVLGCLFDIITPLKEYGHYNNFGKWIPVILETREELLMKEKT